MRGQAIFELRHELVGLETNLVHDAEDTISLVGVAAIQCVDAVGLEGILDPTHLVLRAKVEVALHQRVGLRCSSNGVGHFPCGGTLRSELDSVSIVQKFHVLLRPGNSGGCPYQRTSANWEVDGALLRAVLAQVVRVADHGCPVAVAVWIPVGGIGHWRRAAGHCAGTQWLWRSEVATSGRPSNSGLEFVQLCLRHDSRLHHYIKVNCLRARGRCERAVVVPVVREGVSPVQLLEV
mmetsp:Transcript_64795/g.146122  ORF Transcript_64795/g.146122 Transcript_64795/m.146122 type:complete len:236 (-) Transcript_64795:4594-5301(-)